MSVEKAIDRLIAAARNLLDDKWDAAVFEKWRSRAFRCLKAFLGPGHTYTRYFYDFVRNADKAHLLVGTGLLVAAREQLAMAHMT